MAHIVLFGDSIFDNKVYVGKNGKDVITHLRELIPNDWQATLKAVDGNVIENVSQQFSQTPTDVTHFVISVGGNDAIGNADILQMNAGNSAEVLNEIAERCETFEVHYKEMLQNVLSRNIPTTVCTIYLPNFSETVFQRLSVTALSFFNDIIIRQAIMNNLPIIDLRLICNEADDYANEIEPSDKGGRKIAEKILELVNEHNFSSQRTQIFA
jgi:hypothetical protein